MVTELSNARKSSSQASSGESQEAKLFPPRSPRYTELTASDTSWKMRMKETKSRRTGWSSLSETVKTSSRASVLPVNEADLYHLAEGLWFGGLPGSIESWGTILKTKIKVSILNAENPSFLLLFAKNWEPVHNSYAEFWYSSLGPHTGPTSVTFNRGQPYRTDVIKWTLRNKRELSNFF